MSGTRRIIRQTMTVARRDFVATVFTPTFLLFLLAPLIMAGFGAIGGLGAATMADSRDRRVQIVALAAPEDGARLVAVDKRLRGVFRERDAPPPLRVTTPRADVAAQARALIDSSDIDISAVLYGPLEAPTVLYGAQGARTASYLVELADQALRIDSAAGAEPVARATRIAVARETASIGGQGQAAFFTVFGLFFLTLLLAGQAVGTMAEERSNKVIEVLAAAVPLESVFLGKLIGMFGVALLFLSFWAGVAFNIGSLVPPELARGFASIGPAVGMPAFVLLFLAYFTMAYMLLGAVFLGIGAQASTPREIQMLSLPITIVQVGMFGLSSAAAANPGSWVATFAEVFPFSSPFAMGARAANSPELWRHALAIAWQLLWVAITVGIGARLFRRGVLQSAGPKMRWWPRRGSGAVEAAGEAVSP
ncbi:ABC transporter permease [Sphingomonas baiyangensis]|uniref:ABC transporter permease n=1 Tax=Sphingomonas baiyangensis TaxID=2572576 RepID=A0A4U1L9S0_9SPHN|nr:ABC transporter permease [Sphingomonas baiyangensis]TKD53195.1 ABC transporter permease [Sphingomonas baiyangensis]